MMNTKKDIKNTRTENTIRNIIAGLINKIIVLLLPFFVRTVIIYRMGVEYVGVSSLFTSVLQVLNVSELGFASAIIYTMYEPVAKNDVPEIKAKIRLFRSVYKIVGITILICGLIVLPFLKNLIKGDIPEDINIYFIFLILLADAVIGYFAFGYKNAVLTVYQRNDLISKVNSVINIIKCFIQITVIIFFGNFYVYVVIVPIMTLLSNVILNILSNRIHPELKDNYKFSFDGLKDIKKQIGGIAIGRISLVCRNSFDSIILSTLFGLTLTAVYSNYYLVFSSVSGFMSILITSMSASVGNSLVMESIEKNEADHRRFDFFYEMITGFCVICLFTLYQSFMKVWVGEKLMIPMLSMILFCVYFYVDHLAQVRSAYSEAAGLWWYFRYLSVAEIVANIVLNFSLGKIWGINGILIATIVTAFFCSFFGCTIITYKKLFKKTPLQYFFNNFVYSFVTIVGCALSYIITRNFSVTGWISFLFEGLFCAGFAFIYLFVSYFMIGFTRDELKLLYGMIVERLKI